jgi:trk/ktr system potassium uptake protein
MKAKSVFYAIGRLLQLTGGILLVPLGISVYDGYHAVGQVVLTQQMTMAFLVTILVSTAAGTILTAMFHRNRNDQGIKEGFAIVTLGWIFMALVGSIPFVFWFLEQQIATGSINLLSAITDAYFEVMSGFTTTGATILSDIEALPRSLLFWRSLTHWLGGMGIITLALAIFPAMGVGGYQMFRGEVPGPSADRLRPRLAETAKILWGVYVLLSAAETLLLKLGGMDMFDALCHTFGTMATGGFSTRNASVGAFQSAYIDWIIIIFMFLAGTNFMIHYRVLFHRDWNSIFYNREFRFYLGTIVATTILIAAMLSIGGLPAAEQTEDQFRYSPLSAEAYRGHVAAEEAKVTGDVSDTIRYALFQVVGILTTTGFGTADFDLWPRALGLTLLVLMFWGGCAGSTGGGMKMIRILIVIKAGWRELKKMVRPRLISPVKISGQPVHEAMIRNVQGFFLLFIGLFVICSIIMSFYIEDLTTAVSSVAATIGNIGPGLCGVGSTQTYGWIPIGGKWVLIMCMLLGRLEIFTVLVVLRPSFWKR